MPGKSGTFARFHSVKMARALCPGASYHEQTVLQSHTCTTSDPTQNNDMYGKEHGQGTSLSAASAAHITVCSRRTALWGDYAGTSQYKCIYFTSMNFNSEYYTHGICIANILL